MARAAAARQEEAPPTPELSDEGANEEVARQLTTAQSLHDARVELMKRQAANRSILRSYVTLGDLSDAQRAAIEKFYPKRERKPESPAEEVAGTNGDQPVNPDTPAE
jgi:hypothetical protein